MTKRSKEIPHFCFQVYCTSECYTIAYYCAGTKLQDSSVSRLIDLYILGILWSLLDLQDSSRVKRLLFMFIVRWLFRNNSAASDIESFFVKSNLIDRS